MAGGGKGGGGGGGGGGVDEGNGGGRGASHVKLFVPLVELASQAVQSSLAILEELPAESAEEVHICMYASTYASMCSTTCLRCVASVRVCNVWGVR